MYSNEEQSHESSLPSPGVSSYAHTGPTGSLGAQSAAPQNHSRLQHDLSRGAQSQYFGSRPGVDSPVNVKAVSNTIKTHPPKHNNFFSHTMKQPSKKQKDIRVLRDHHKSKGSQDKVSKQSSSVSSKQFGCSIIVSSENILSQKPQQSHGGQETLHKSSFLKPTGIDKTSKCHSMSFKKEMSSDSQQAYAFASQDLGPKASMKDQSQRSQATGDKNTCVGSSDQLSKLALSLNNKRKFRATFNGESSNKYDSKIKSSSNLLESSGGNSGTSHTAALMTQNFAQVANIATTKQLKAHRGGAPGGTSSGFTLDDETQMQSTFRIFQTDMSQGRAAQRYASVDKEELESHISLSSCVSEGGKPSTNRLSAKNKGPKELSHKKTTQFQTLISQVQNGAHLPRSGESMKQGHSGLPAQQVNNFLSFSGAGASGQKSSSNRKDGGGHRHQPKISVDCEDDTSFPVGGFSSKEQQINYLRLKNQREQHLGQQQQHPQMSTNRQGETKQNPEDPKTMQHLNVMNKIQSVDDLYSGPSMMNSKTAVVQKEGDGYMHGFTSDKKSYNKTPNGPLEGKAHNHSSLSPNSRTTSSYRDSESLGFALSERQKAHHLKQLRLRQMLEQKHQGPNIHNNNPIQYTSHYDGGSALNLGTNEQISLRLAMNQVSNEAPLNQILQLPERALQMKQQHANGNKTEIKQAAARTLQRLQFEQQNSDSPNYSKQLIPQSLEQHHSNIMPSHVYPNQHGRGAAMIAIQEQQDSEDNTQSLMNTQSQQNIRSHKLHHDISDDGSPSKMNAIRGKPQKKNIDKEVIKYFKRMVKNQQIDKFKAQMNSQSTIDVKEERNLSPRPQHRARVSQKKIKLAHNKPSKESQKSNNNPIIVDSIGRTVTYHTSSQSVDTVVNNHPDNHHHLEMLQRAQHNESSEVMSNFFQTQPNGIRSDELGINVEPQQFQEEHQRKDSSKGYRKSVPRLPIERITNIKQEEKVINIVTGGSFGRQSNNSKVVKPKAQSPNTQRPPNTVPSQVVVRHQAKNDHMSERREFHRTLKKAIVSLQQLQTTQKSTTGETPYNTHGRKQKSNRPERNQSFSSYNSSKVKSQDGVHTKTQRTSQMPHYERIERGITSPKESEQNRKKPSGIASPSKKLGVEKAGKVDFTAAVSTRKHDSSNLIFTMQNVKETFGTPTANPRKMTVEDARLMAQMEASADDYMHCSTKQLASSCFAGDSAEFNTFGRPSAQSQEIMKESSFRLDSSPTKEYAEGIDMPTPEQSSIRKIQKKRKVAAKQLIPKPEPSKRLRKTIKTKKKQMPESGKMLSMGTHTGPHSLTGSKRCSTSHFGVVKSQQSSAGASKESSKRQSIVSSLSKRSAKLSSEAAHYINSEKGLKPQSSSGYFMATPILKKSMIKKAGGSGQCQESRKQLNLNTKETCSTQQELKKKLGQIFKQQQLQQQMQQANIEQTFETVSNHNNAGSIKAAQMTKKRRQSQADSNSVRRPVQNQSKVTMDHLLEPQQKHPMEILSPKGIKKIVKSRENSKKEGGGQKTQLGQLYTQLNTLLVQKEGSSLLSNAKDRKTPGYQHQLKRNALKGSLQSQLNPHGLAPSSSQQVINEKKPKLSGASMVKTDGIQIPRSILRPSATQQEIVPVQVSQFGGTGKATCSETFVTPLQSKPSHSRKKSEAVLKKNGSSSNLIISDHKWQQMTIQQPVQGSIIQGAAVATTQQKPVKKAVNVNEQRGRKVDLMQPLTSFFINNQGKPQSAKDAVSAQGARGGKSRNVSDQCYQRGNQGSGVQYSMVNPNKMLYKTSGQVMGASRNSKQQFGTLAGLQSGPHQTQHQYQSHGHILRHNHSSGGTNRQQLSEVSMNGQQHQVMSGGGPPNEATHNFTRESIRKGEKSSDHHPNQQYHKSSMKKSQISSTQPLLDKAGYPQQQSTRTMSKTLAKVKRQESLGVSNGGASASGGGPPPKTAAQNHHLQQRSKMGNSSAASGRYQH